MALYGNYYRFLRGQYNEEQAVRDFYNWLRTSGIITVVLGVITILAPMASMTMAMLVAAVALLIDGVTEIIFGLGM